MQAMSNMYKKITMLPEFAVICIRIKSAYLVKPHEANTFLTTEDSLIVAYICRLFSESLKNTNTKFVNCSLKRTRKPSCLCWPIFGTYRTPSQRQQNLTQEQ
jgi:hypothetical protein